MDEPAYGKNEVAKQPSDNEYYGYEIKHKIVFLLVKLVQHYYANSVPLRNAVLIKYFDLVVGVFLRSCWGIFS